jgi:exopolyphosphatase/guanosine-5'-triphosphate,3'-diphosphate pyrophosphatase
MLNEEQTLQVSDQPIAVIDIGSNSARVVVMRPGSTSHLEILAEGRSPLRLARDLVEGGSLSSAAIDRAVAALRDFEAIATAVGSSRTIAAATAAVRESANAADFLERARRECGLDVVVIDGDVEARCSFFGAVHGVQADHGVFADIGGGSMELMRFRDRRPGESWTLPLGSLKLSDEFLGSDPPAEREVERLRAFAHETIRDTGVGTLAVGEHLVGTGGTIRNLAKMDQRTKKYPISRIHGYVLARRRVEALRDLLASRPLRRRRSIRGLNADRADSIVGGAIVAGAVLDALGADEITVSGQGLREGLAYGAMGVEMPSAEEVRRASLAALVARFTSWDPGRADRRRRIAASLLATLEPEAGSKRRERLEEAGTVVDIGRSIDYYERYAHAAGILLTSDLEGFSHRKLALLAALLEQAGDEKADVLRYRPLVGQQDRQSLARDSTILNMADEIERRMPPGRDPPVRCEVRGRDVMLRAPVFDLYRQSILAERFRRAFAKLLVIQAEDPGLEGSSD